MTTLLSILLLLLVTLFFLYYKYMQKDLKEAETNAILLKIMSQNTTLAQDNEKMEHKQIELIQNLNGLLTEKLKTMQKLDVLSKDRKNMFFLKDLERQVFGGMDHWEVMLNIIDSLYPGLQDEIRQDYPQMDELEYKVCLLTRFNLSRQEEAQLLNVSISVLDKVRGRVKHWILEEKSLDG